MSRKSFFQRLCCALVCILASANSLFAAQLQLLSDAHWDISGVDIAAAGQDYDSSLLSEPGFIVAAINCEDPQESWQLKISADAGQLPTPLKLYARVSGPLGPREGLEFVQADWIALDYPSQLLARGSGSPGVIELQLRLDGLRLAQSGPDQLYTRLSLDLEGE